MNYSCSSLIQTLLSVPEFWLVISHRISRFARVADFTAGREFWVIFSHPAPKNFLLHDCIIYLTLLDCNIKIKNRVWNMTDGENWLLNISDTETASLPRNTKDSCRCFCIRYVYSQLLPSGIFLSFIFHFIWQWCPPGRAPRESPASPAASPLPQIKSGEGDERKNSSQEIL